MFERELKRQQYGVGVTQILTKNLITALNVQTTTEEGYLNNPYRSVRYVDPTVARGYSYEPELYPNTRTANAAGVRARYFLPYRAAIKGDVVFGTWVSDAALMTCLLFDLDAGLHVHFIDGADGGYTRAARKLKSGLARTSA